MAFNHPRASGPGPSSSSSVPFPMTRYDSTAAASATSELDVTHSHNRYMSTVSFPGTGRFSINRASALELHDLIYGSGTALSLANSEGARAALDKLYEPDAVYSNPLLTASSGDVIKDIHSLLHQFTAVSVPTPFSLFGRYLKRADGLKWLTVAKLWSEVGEVLESDVYDGHRRVVIEHTVYLLLLPDIFPPDSAPPADSLALHTSASSISLSDTNFSGGPNTNSGGAHPSLGGAARMLTTLARQISLPVHTRLSFNDSGRITHHQDIWDVKDVLALIPGVGMMQWVGSRVLAHGLSVAFDTLEWASARAPRDGVKKEGDETPRGGSV